MALVDFWPTHLSNQHGTKPSAGEWHRYRWELASSSPATWTWLWSIDFWLWIIKWIKKLTTLSKRRDVEQSVYVPKKKITEFGGASTSNRLLAYFFSFEFWALFFPDAAIFMFSRAVQTYGNIECFQVVDLVFSVVNYTTDGSVSCSTLPNEVLSAGQFLWPVTARPFCVWFCECWASFFLVQILARVPPVFCSIFAPRHLLRGDTDSSLEKRTLRS